MPITRAFTLPASATQLSLPNANAPLYLIFISSKHPDTGLPWCPDVRAAMPNVEAAFSAPDAPHLAIVEVGQKPEWKDTTNVFRTKWNVQAIPALVRYERKVDGAVGDVGRLVEGELLDQSRIEGFIA
ncbi:DUF953 domain protein [Byssothecium circinans]|uniref:DUF953 domain protein n=1 Tax=Byssothecium circinans TaxID=147558 RepID=A0A6A5TAK9_9PLEO|nr:DUF953 domain protein [Byssothecium circinans]